MEESIKKAQDLLNSQGFLVLYTTTARIVGFMKNTDIISITSGRFVILSSNGSKIKKTFPFTDLSEVSVQNNSIKLVFGKITYSFESNETEQILNSIKDVIRHTLTALEQRNIIIDDYKVVPYIQQNGFAADCRLYDGAMQYPNTDQYFNEIEKIIMYMQPTVSLSDYKNPREIIQPLLNILPFCPNIQNLKIPKIDGIDIYELIRPFIKNNFTLKHLSIEGEKTKHFAEFLSLLKHNSDSRLLGHSFKNTNMTRIELDLLYKYCSERKIQSLGFHRAIKSDSMDYFYNSFLVPDLFDTLYVLNLSNNTNIDLRKLLPRLRQIRYLSLSNCRIEICDVLSYASNMNQIKCIDLSHNNCNSMFNKNLSSTLRFPPSFDTLIIDDVSFTSSCIIPFLSFIFNRFEHGLRLSIASLITTEEVWSQIFDFLGKTTFKSLVSLVWDKNRLNLKLFAFLLNNPFFENLSMNSCLSSSSSDLIKSLGLFIQGSRTLKSLSIRGDDEKNLGPNLYNLLKMASTSKSLKFLDISYSKCGESGLKTIFDFISLPDLNLETFVFDDAIPSKSETTVKILQKASKLKGKILISFPENDVTRLVKNKSLTKDKSASLRKGLIISQDLIKNSSGTTSNNNSNITNSSSIKNNSEIYDVDSFFLKPFNIYKYFEEEKFPYFISQATIHQIAKKSYLIDNVPDSPQRKAPQVETTKTSSVRTSASSPNVPRNPVIDDDKRKTYQQDKKVPRKQLNPTINVFAKEEDPQDRVKRSQNRNKVSNDQISRQIFEFDVEEEKKALNRSKNTNNSSDGDDIISKLNTKKRHAQSLRRQRPAPKAQESTDNNNPPPRRTRTQSTRVRRKPTKNSTKQTERNLEKNQENNKNNDNQDIIRQAKKRRGRSVDSINKEKKKQVDDSNDNSQKNNKPAKNKIRNDYESEDYNLNSDSSDEIINNNNNKNKNRNDDDDDDMNVTAPILRTHGKNGSTKNAQLNKTMKTAAGTKKTQRDKTQNKVVLDSSSRTKNKDTSEPKNESGKSTPRRSRIKNKGKRTDDYDSDNALNDAVDDDADFEPIKYKPINWEFPELKTKNNETEFWNNLKSEFEYNKLVEI